VRRVSNLPPVVRRRFRSIYSTHAVNLSNQLYISRYEGDDELIRERKIIIDLHNYVYRWSVRRGPVRRGNQSVFISARRIATNNAFRFEYFGRINITRRHLFRRRDSNGTYRNVSSTAFHRHIDPVIHAFLNRLCIYIYIYTHRQTRFRRINELRRKQKNSIAASRSKTLKLISPHVPSARWRETYGERVSHTKRVRAR